MGIIYSSLELDYTVPTLGDKKVALREDVNSKAKKCLKGSKLAFAAL